LVWNAMQRESMIHSESTNKSFGMRRDFGLRMYRKRRGDNGAR